jgi:leucyl/phenylalanyl-tRNA--protein transferase
MPVFNLSEELIFPHPILREPDGLLAVGGDLSPQRLILAYRWGIFPWYHEGQPILWWWLTPRLMLKPGEIHISHSVRNYINQNRYTVTFNQSFKSVIGKCAEVKRKGQKGTWIMPEMMDAYTQLHEMGYAQSVEVWEHNVLVGGLYGVTIGRIFTGESMFAEKPNASKIGLVALARALSVKGFVWIDCQQDTPHMRTMGGRLMEAEDFLGVLRANQMEQPLELL